MPKVLEIAGWRVVIYPNDHRPAHVHIIGGGNEAVFRLNCPPGPVELRENYGFSRRELGIIEKRLSSSLAMLCNTWRRIHDHY